MRRGISRDGHQLYPAFPYIHYASITEREITATYAYLMSREPVYSVVPNNQLMFPLGFRPLISFWNTIYLDKERTHSDPTQSAEWNRGRALVDGLGHCSACHTPLNLIGGERSGRALDGGVIDGWDAYPLNKLLHGTSPWTQKELVTYLRTGLSSEHGAAAGPMFAVTQELSMVPEEDVRAIAKYIMAIQRPPPSAAILVSKPDAGDIASVARGATLFAGACAACHDAASPMQMIAHRPSLASSSAVSANSPRNTIQMILEGMPWHAPKAGPYMPRFADQLTNTQIADLANYLRATQTTRPPWSEVTEIVAEVRKENGAR
ncbi:c-type cytochrome [Cupriavidus sp. D39]|nr:cytochrome c [Cupriavidus sp. D39]MCY0852620.1 c-type cytochrome [Cupriavidus sp. D39]